MVWLQRVVEDGPSEPLTPDPAAAYRYFRILEALFRIMETWRGTDPTQEYPDASNDSRPRGS
jgi:hypothetical protein